MYRTGSVCFITYIAKTKSLTLGSSRKSKNQKVYVFDRLLNSVRMQISIDIVSATLRYTTGPLTNDTHLSQASLV